MATQSVSSIPNWLEKHQAELADVTIHQIQIIEGAHYLHWTQAPTLARAITDFVAAHVAR